ncbi:MAG: glycosyltransferase family 2 protein [Burkholderiales bacterium]|nr:glycosyltransferase family 2 protein [Burkholderiales bacterium]
MNKWTIIICCYNSESRIKATLDSIFTAIKKYNSNAIEIILVDNLCTDQTVKYALETVEINNFTSFKIIRESKAGLMYARMSGVMAASGQYIAFIDDDNWPTEKYLHIAETIFDSDTSVGVFGCATKLPSDRYIPEAIQRYASSFAIGHLPFESGLLDTGQCVWGAGMAVRASKLKSIFKSGFSPILVGRSQSTQLAGDDSEIVLAMVLSGCSVWYENTPLILHAVDPSRFNYKNVIKMNEGFGSSALFLQIYSICTKSTMINSSLIFFAFAPLILAKDFFALFKCFIATKSTSNIDLKLLKRFFYLKWFCYLSNPKMRMLQKINIAKAKAVLI